LTLTGFAVKLSEMETVSVLGFTTASAVDSSGELDEVALKLSEKDGQ
jgi:hypothetical protein